MRSHVVSACVVLLTSSLLVLPSYGGKPSSAGRNVPRGFSDTARNSLEPAQPGVRQRAFPGGRTERWGHDGSAERREIVTLRNHQQRQERAEHLRGFGERNGNSRLGDTATRMQQRLNDRPAKGEHPAADPYKNIQIFPEDPPAENAGTASQPARKLSWAERLRSWRPWRR